MNNIIIMGASGRMGKAIHTLAEEQGFTITALIERECSLEKLAIHAEHCLIGSDVEKILAEAQSSVIIDFTAPEASVQHAKLAAKYGHGIVIGTTGLNPEQEAELTELAKEHRIFASPNMSVGVNVMCEILPALVRMLGPDYDLELVELHHNRKVDSPSGTALRLAEVLANARSWKLSDVACYHREGLIGARKNEEIGVQTVRGGDVVGVHTIYMMGQGERLEFTHQAHSRDNFARGALRAAKWLPTQKTGKVYNMQDLLRIEELLGTKL